MSAPSIPNLLSLRSSRGGRGRGHGRGSHSSSRSGPDHDEVIQGTDTDAAVSRLSAVSLGYLDDLFAPYFVTDASGPATRRLPIINRGTYTRTTALDRLVRTFLQTCDSGEKQIVSLGAGTDTRSLRLFAPSSAAKGLIYHEIDFSPICTRKLRIVQANPILRQVLGNPAVDEGGGYWECNLPNGSYFSCRGVDLRELVQKDASAFSGLRTDIPTLLISECCLCYLETSTAADVIRWFTDKIPSLAIAIYEPIKPNDPFGQMMVSNLAARRIRMPTLQTYQEIGDQEGRLRQAGFEQVKVMTVEDIWEKWVPEAEKDRVDSLEGLDEVEEWKLLAGHYIVGWASRGNGLGEWMSRT